MADFNPSEFTLPSALMSPRLHCVIQKTLVSTVVNKTEDQVN